MYYREFRGLWGCILIIHSDSSSHSLCGMIQYSFPCSSEAIMMGETAYVPALSAFILAILAPVLSTTFFSSQI